MSTTEVTETERGRAPVYRAGTRAWIDSAAGMIPCTALEVVTDGCGWIVAPASGVIRIRVNADQGGYRRGEVITGPASDIVPRPQRFTRHGSHWVNALYVWAA
jgi:hypothetical protein